MHIDKVRRDLKVIHAMRSGRANHALGAELERELLVQFIQDAAFATDADEEIAQEILHSISASRWELD